MNMNESETIAYNSNIENGRMNPTLSTLEKISGALGISSSELLK
jgi:transcriptional regulator with XRE-family HTH domain